ncbi:MAG: glycosyltransferase family 9 protein [Deltaproteobacteria bacterium]|nr:glycosyltransferase family 9 protein [Deltaproteobacteria bacterium]
MNAVAATPAQVLFRSPNWVGDAILAVPAIEALREAFPAARLSALAVPWVGDVFRFVPAVDEVVRFDRKGRHRGFLGTERLARELRARRLDLAVTFPRSASSAWLLWRSGARERLGYAGTAPRGWLTLPVRFPGKGRPGHHELELHLGLVRGLGLAAPVRAPRLAVPGELRARREELLRASGLDGRAYLAVAPGAAFGVRSAGPPRGSPRCATPRAKSAGSRR